MTENSNGKQNDNREEDIDLEAKLLNNGIKQPPENEKSEKEAEKNGDENEVKMSIDIDKMLKDMPLTDDLTCGFWIFKGRFFQMFANQTAYVCLYGLVGCVFSMTYAYFNGTITTIEKRFKIPSKNTGIISVGNDISQMFVSAALSYYAGKGHRPRWIGFGLLTIVIFCLLTALPHFLYGPGEDALSLTEEFGAMPDENSTMEVLEAQKSKLLCRDRGNGLECEQGEGNLAPQLVLFLAQFISGIGGSLYYTLGVSYMDDNTKKSKTAALLSLSYFLRMLGPAAGYALASFCLRVYIAPNLRPVIGQKDPRWLGAWWMGWILLGGLLALSGFFLTMFPKQLPRAAARQIVEAERKKRKEKDVKKSEKELEAEIETPASMKDMLKTFKRLLKNPTLMCNNFSSVFYLFGYAPYWIFTPKYIEIQYRQSAATSSLVTGTIALGFSALGILLSGYVISKFKPKARSMAAWNVLVGFLTVAGMLTYSFIGCPDNEKSVIVNIHDSSTMTSTCNSNCQCDYVRYSPICGEDGMTYISPCHAGCKNEQISSKGIKTYFDCSCIPTNNSTKSSPVFARLTALNENSTDGFLDLDDGTATITPLDFGSGGQAVPGSCPVNCYNYFVTFLAVLCALKFVGATGRASNFLVSVRCVPEKDKTAAMGFGLMMMSLFAFIPSPIFFGWVIDKLCLVWGKTCSNKGNCWLYDPESLRYTLNFIASTFVTLGSIFDVGVWYYVKDLKIFDEEIKDVELKVVQHEEDATAEKKTEI